MSRIHKLSDVVDWRLCSGCGACASICPGQKIQLRDVTAEGIRPVIQDAQSCEACSRCLDVCPSYETDHSEINARAGALPDLIAYCGPVLEIWEGHAADPEIRYAGSSGGLITALSLYCLEREEMHGVLHIGADPENPVRNRTTLSRSRAELMKKTGSRYAPASACDSLALIENAPSPCVFVGQPTEVTALRKAQELRPGLDRNVGVALSFFCAGSPSTKGTVELLKKLGIAPEELRDLRYRGNGWPGHFAATREGEDAPAGRMTYRESWAFLQAYRPFSTHLNPDGTGEDADISCGDPWYREVKEGEPGSSLVVVRTELGRRMVRAALKAGYIELKPASEQQLLESQRNLINKRRAIWGRLMTMRLFGLPVPKLHGFSLFKIWRQLPFKEKLRSTFGTARRIIARRYFLPLDLDALERVDPPNGPVKASPVEARACADPLVQK